MRSYNKPTKRKAEADRRKEEAKEKKWRKFKNEMKVEQEKEKQVRRHEEWARTNRIKTPKPLDYYTTGVRRVVSGGLPSLGKRSK